MLHWRGGLKCSSRNGRHLKKENFNVIHIDVEKARNSPRLHEPITFNFHSVFLSRSMMTHCQSVSCVCGHTNYTQTTHLLTCSVRSCSQDQDTTTTMMVLPVRAPKITKVLSLVHEAHSVSWCSFVSYSAISKSQTHSVTQHVFPESKRTPTSQYHKPRHNQTMKCAQHIKLP